MGIRDQVLMTELGLYLAALGYLTWKWWDR